MSYQISNSIHHRYATSADGDMSGKGMLDGFSTRNSSRVLLLISVHGEGADVEITPMWWDDTQEKYFADPEQAFTVEAEGDSLYSIETRGTTCYPKITRLHSGGEVNIRYAVARFL